MEAKDKKECELTQPANFEWVRALDAQGNSIRISKTDLIKVVEELIWTSPKVACIKSIRPGDDIVMFNGYGILMARISSFNANYDLMFVDGEGITPIVKHTQISYSKDSGKYRIYKSGSEIHLANYEERLLGFEVHLFGFSL